MVVQLQFQWHEQCLQARFQFCYLQRWKILTTPSSTNLSEIKKGCRSTPDVKLSPSFVQQGERTITPKKDSRPA